jgi:hypothetical protein
LFLSDEFYTAKLGPSLLPDTTKLLLKYYADEKTTLVYIAYLRIARTFALTKKRKDGKKNKNSMDTDYHYSYTDNRWSKLLASPPILLFNENVHAGTA